MTWDRKTLSSHGFIRSLTSVLGSQKCGNHQQFTFTLRLVHGFLNVTLTIMIYSLNYTCAVKGQRTGENHCVAIYAYYGVYPCAGVCSHVCVSACVCVCVCAPFMSSLSTDGSSSSNGKWCWTVGSGRRRRGHSRARERSSSPSGGRSAAQGSQDQTCV